MFGENLLRKRGTQISVDFNLDFLGKGKKEKQHLDLGTTS